MTHLQSFIKDLTTIDYKLLSFGLYHLRHLPTKEEVSKYHGSQIIPKVSLRLPNYRQTSIAQTFSDGLEAVLISDGGPIDPEDLHDRAVWRSMSKKEYECLLRGDAIGGGTYKVGGFSNYPKAASSQREDGQYLVEFGGIDLVGETTATAVTLTDITGVWKCHYGSWIKLWEVEAVLEGGVDKNTNKAKQAEIDPELLDFWVRISNGELSKEQLEEQEEKDQEVDWNTISLKTYNSVDPSLKPQRIIDREQGLSCWDYANWEKYPKTLEVQYFLKDISIEWVEKEFTKRDIEKVVEELITSNSSKNQQFYLNKILDISFSISGHTDKFWNTIGKKGVPFEPLWWSLYPLEVFHKAICNDFSTVNFPLSPKVFSGDPDIQFGFSPSKLFFGRDFVALFDRLILRKIQLIELFFNEVYTLIGLKPEKEYLIRKGLIQVDSKIEENGGATEDKKAALIDEAEKVRGIVDCETTPTTNEATDFAKYALNNADEGNVAKALRKIKVLSSNNVLGEKIMADEDYKRLVTYVTDMIEKEELPVKEKQIPQLNLSAGFLRYLFYDLHKELYTTVRIRDYFIKFLHNTFKQFENWDIGNLKGKFSEKPPTYDQDLKKMVDLINKS